MSLSGVANTPVFLNSLGIVCALGCGRDAIEQALFDSDVVSPLKVSESWSGNDGLPVGEYSGVLAETLITAEDTRNNRMLQTAVNQIQPQIEDLKKRFPASRIGVVIGTSTSGISDGEMALAELHRNGQFPEGYHYSKQEISSPSRYLAKSQGLRGPAFSVSSACTSGAKALASGKRLLDLGVCDAVIAGGVDTLCQMTIQGFSSLSVTTSELCKPFSANRNGINIGEGAALFIMSRDQSGVQLAGIGESSDAHHISSPHPNGDGAELAMRQALESAGIGAEAVDYLNFHGTGTDQNDRMEALATSRVFGKAIACGSTKGLTGHTLAAAGAVEAAFCWMALQRDDGKLPVHAWDGAGDPDLPELENLALRELGRKVKVAMSNSFAFGGNNAALLMVSA